MFAKLFGKNAARRRRAHSLYAGAMAQARQPGLFQRFGVPDTLDGRFDMAVLHVFALVRVLEQAGPTARDLQRDIQEAMFDNLDTASREHGIGDLSVGKHVTRMATAFFGRLSAYGQALDAADDREAELAHALARNVFREEAAGENAHDLANYILRQIDHIDANRDAIISSGEIQFLNPEEVQ